MADPTTEVLTAMKALRIGAQMKVKIHLDGDTRILPERPKDFTALQSVAFETFGVTPADRPKYLLKYHDDDADLVTMTTDREFIAAFALASRTHRNYLKVFVVRLRPLVGCSTASMFGVPMQFRPTQQ